MQWRVEKHFYFFGEVDQPRETKPCSRPVLFDKILIVKWPHGFLPRLMNSEICYHRSMLYQHSVRLGEIAYNVSLNKTHSMSHASGFAPAFFVMFCNTAESVIILNDFTVL